MRLLVRSPVRAPAVPLPRAVGDERRAWIEALFGDRLPRGARREAAIRRLAADREVWRLLHQARHSLAETTAVLERLATRALADIEPLRAA